MRSRQLVLLLLLAVPVLPRSAGAQSPLPARSQAAKSAPTLYVIPHTHWEGAVFETREEYLQDGLPNIAEALRFLRIYPEYRFVLDQAAYVKPFLERYPGLAAEFRSYVAQGRLEIVGGTDVMLDSNIPSGESWIRQVLYGKSYFRKALGIDVTTGWAIDTFGHNDQMPQLLTLAGYRSYWFQRGVPDNRTPSEFLWAGIDGTRIPAFWLPLGYGLFYPVKKNPLEFDAYARSLWTALGEASPFSDRVALAGADVIRPEHELPEMARAFNAKADAPFQLRFAVPSDFAEQVSRRADRPVVQGELNPIFQGTYSNRIELKQSMREDERILTTSEKLGVVAGIFGAPSQSEQRWQAWEPVLFNQAHDLTSGTMIDKVYRETVEGYRLSKDMGGNLIRADLETIADRVDTRNKNQQAIPILVFNTLGWVRADIAQVDVQFTQPGVSGMVLRAPDGQEQPFQVTASERDTDGGIRKASVAFVARDIPAIGWSVYSLIPRYGEPAPPTNDGLSPSFSLSNTTMHADSASIENEFYRATFNLWSGAITGLEVKNSAGGWQVLGEQPGNIVACEQDGGDSWELYGNLNGGRFTAMRRFSGLPERDRSHLSNEWVGGNGHTTSGPVFSEFRIEHPFGDNAFSTRVRIYAGIQRIDFETSLVNRDKFVRYRLLFPTSIHSGKRFDEIPFAAIERPESREFPAQNWIDWGDENHGVALLNVGLPGSNISGGTLLLSLLRSAHINDYPLIGGYEGDASDLGLELGQPRTFQYALVPHEGSWQQARVFRSGLELNNPLLVSTLQQHPGDLSTKWGLLEISSPNVVLSALAPAQDGHGVIARVYEATGQPAPAVQVHFAGGVQEASEVNLMEDKIRSLPVENGAIHFDLHPFEIKTFRLQWKSQPPA